jgi:hypothetical protein
VELDAGWTDRWTLGATLYSNTDYKCDIKTLNALKRNNILQVILIHISF